MAVDLVMPSEKIIQKTNEDLVLLNGELAGKPNGDRTGQHIKARLHFEWVFCTKSHIPQPAQIMQAWVILSAFSRE